MSDLIQKNTHKDFIDSQAQSVVDFLEQIGLPSDSIIVEQSHAPGQQKAEWETSGAFPDSYAKHYVYKGEY